MKKSLILILVTIALLAVGFYLNSPKNDNRNTSKSGNIKWVDSPDLQVGPIRRESFSDEQVDQIREIHKIMGKYDGQTIEKWVDDFRRDMNPDREIAIWQSMAKAMSDVEKRSGHNDVKNKESYKIVLMSSMAPYEQAKDHMMINGIPEDEIISIYKLFSRYYSATAQQGDAPEPASPAR